MAELIFTTDGLFIAEYETITPLFGLLRGRPKQAATEMRSRYLEGGVDNVLSAADTVHRLDYDTIDRVDIYDGGRIGREKIAVHTEDGPPYAYRMHTPVDVQELADVLTGVLDEQIYVHAGVGFDPRASVARFLAGR
ncbi:hypothetical protein BG842_03795 [Haladaptatus sp. W1]|nr:hypothetical protein BG842_03795 [Haladaptatus sp. W1]